ncbi:MAG TPA: hypothetical protein VG125_05500 [Pirellulales bacterium]|nr:hypothetical protein [Pirellulales bacterium]
MVLWQLLMRSWWRYATNESSAFSIVYHWFNVAEGIAWCLIAGLVLRRYLKGRKSSLEIAYGVAFLTFGLSDFIEAHVLTTWLILAKGANLAALLLLRRRVLRRHYPESKTF